MYNGLPSYPMMELDFKHMHLRVAIDVSPEATHHHMHAPNNTLPGVLLVTTGTSSLECCTPNCYTECIFDVHHKWSSHLCS